MSPPFSRYTPEILAFLQATNAKAGYCFAIDGSKGTGGMPIVMGTPPRDEYLARCRELVRMLRRSADLLERDIGDAPAGDTTAGLE